MTANPALLDAVLKLKAEMQSNLIKTRKGDIIDISKLPGRLLDLHNQVKIADEDERPVLTATLEDVLSILDDLSGEIQQRYNEISDQVSFIENDGTYDPQLDNPQAEKKE